MNEWLLTLTQLERTCLYVAVPATLVLILQTVLLLIGLGGGGDADVDGMDADADGADPDGDGVLGGLRLFTVRGIVAFLSIAGWGGLWLLRANLSPLLALFLAVAMGVWSMLLLALLMRALNRLQSDGTVRPGNAVGLKATIYLTVPAAGSGTGKVTALVQERLMEFDAVTHAPGAIKTGESVTITGVLENGTLVVCRDED